MTRSRSSFTTLRPLGKISPVPDADWYLQMAYSQDPSRDKNMLDASPLLGLARFRRDLFPELTLDDLVIQSRYWA